MTRAACQAGDADLPGHLVSTLVSRRPRMTMVYAIVFAAMRVHQLFRILY